MIAAILTLIRCLPEVLGFLQTLIRRIEAAGADRRVKDDLAKIDAAFKNNDAALLNSIFNG